jgi:hypothetical protein
MIYNNNMNNSILIQEFRSKLRIDYDKLDNLLLQPIEVREASNQVKKIRQTIFHINNILKIQEDLEKKES